MADVTPADVQTFLAPTTFVDSDHPAVVAFALEACGDATTEKDRAARLFRAVRERVRYDPYSVSTDPADYRASHVLGVDRAFCVPKAVLLCAAARAIGIPARLGFADVRNHLSSPKLLEVMKTDRFVFHGYTELWIEGRAIKATPAFNATLCARFGVAPLELDGESDALLQPYDSAGRRYMEYIRDRGVFLDLPFDAMIAAYAEAYGPAEQKEDDEVFHE